MYKIVAVILIFINSLSWAGALTEKIEWKEIEAVEFNLKNGMHVILKTMDDDSEQIHIALSALGGYASLPPEQRPAGQLAAVVAWESGLGPISSDQLSVLLYENSLEFMLEIDPFWRGIEGIAPVESLSEFFKIANLFFTRPQFNEAVFKRAVNKAKDVAKRQNDFERTFEDTFLSLNSQKYAGLKNLSSDELETVRFEHLKKFYLEAFSNPADFTLVLAGNFNIDEVLPIIETYLGSLESKGPSKPWSVPALNSFPQGVTTLVLPSQRSVSTTRIAFPIQGEINSHHILCIDDWCHIIEGRLRSALLKKSLSSRGIDVSYEFPYYPYLNQAWFTIQYQSDYNQIAEVNELIFTELKRLQSDGVTKGEVEKAKNSRVNQISIWYEEPEYWAPLLSNHALWGWKLDSRSKTSTGLDSHELPLKKEFSELIPLNQYTQISTKRVAA